MLTSCGWVAGLDEFDLEEARQVSGNGCSVVDEPEGAAPACGDVELLDRGKYGDYEAATFSFEHATRDPTPEVRNDWDLKLELGEFDVRMVTDDQSWIADLGDVPLRDLPATTEPTGTGVTAILGHAYMVRTSDSDSRLYSAFEVTSLTPGDRVTISWVRSPNPDCFALPPCAR